MKTFEEIYNEIQSVDNSEINIAWKEAKEERKKAHKRGLITCLTLDGTIFAIFTLLMLFTDIKELDGGYPLLLPMIFPLLIINLLIYLLTISFTNKKQKEFRKIYKESIISNLINNFFTNVEYFPEKQMPKYIYNEVRYESYDRYHSDDYFEGQLDNKYGVQMGEVKTEEVETRRDAQGRTTTTTRTVFSGLFGKIILNKSINSELRIMQNGKLFFNKERIKMDSNEFEKYFDVKATNQILGMQLLTADVMQDLIDFQNENNIRYDIVIENDVLYLRFHCGRIFEPTNIKNEMIDKKMLEKYYNVLKFTNVLVEKIINLINETEF